MQCKSSKVLWLFPTVSCICLRRRWHYAVYLILSFMRHFCGDIREKLFSFLFRLATGRNLHECRYSPSSPPASPTEDDSWRTSAGTASRHYLLHFYTTKNLTISTSFISVECCSLVLFLTLSISVYIKSQKNRKGYRTYSLFYYLCILPPWNTYTTELTDHCVERLIFAGVFWVYFFCCTGTWLSTTITSQRWNKGCARPLPRLL
jgi:hypothetical protein